MRTLEEIFRSRLEAWSDIQGHLQYMHDVVIEAEAEVIVELGVRSGNSTSAFLAGLGETDDAAAPVGHLWSIDIVAPPGEPEWWRSGLWTLIVGNDLALRDSVPDAIDVLFIDTRHHYQHTLAELRLYGPSARIIIMHDTDLEVPYGMPRGDPKFPVRAAIGAWLSENPERTIFHYGGSYGLGVIR